MTVLAGWQALLSRASGQEDLGVGVAIANRNRREVEGLIGFFVNTLVLRGDLSGAPGFGQLLARVRNSALAAYAHQDCRSSAWSRSWPRADAGRNPLIR